MGKKRRHRRGKGQRMYALANIENRKGLFSKPKNRKKKQLISLNKEADDKKGGLDEKNC